MYLFLCKLMCLFSYLFIHSIIYLFVYLSLNSKLLNNLHLSPLHPTPSLPSPLPQSLTNLYCIDLCVHLFTYSFTLMQIYSSSTIPSPTTFLISPIVGNVTVRTDSTWGVSGTLPTIRQNSPIFAHIYWEYDQDRLNSLDIDVQMSDYDRCKANRRCNWGVTGQCIISTTLITNYHSIKLSFSVLFFFFLHSFIVQKILF